MSAILTKNDEANSRKFKPTVPLVKVDTSSPLTSTTLNPIPISSTRDSTTSSSSPITTSSSKSETSASASVSLPKIVPTIKLSPSRLPMFTRSPISPTTKLHFKDLPSEIKPIELRELDNLKTSSSAQTFIFDIRPFNLFSISRLQNSINLCIPLTLLKRESYSLVSVLGSIDETQRSQILSPDNAANILIYDSESTFDHISFGLYQTCIKFFNFKDKKFNVYYLNGGFSKTTNFGNMIENQPFSPISASSGSFLSSSPEPESQSECSPVFPVDPVINGGANGNGAQGTLKYNLSLSGFALPSSTPSEQKFLSSIKRNSLPKLDTSKKTGIEGNQINSLAESDELRNYEYQFKYPKIDGKIPRWLMFISDIENNQILTSSQKNKEILKILNAKFKKIERSEQARLKRAIASEISTPPNHSPNICSPSALCPGCDKIPYKIPRGIEYGYKNRYNNVWPYEHSRVKLNMNSPASSTMTSPFCNHPNEQDDDYFNANYIHYEEVSRTKYIATQNPLQSTYEDFWKTVWHNNIQIIICLNRQESAPLAGQDFKYFDDQAFKGSKLKIEKIESTEFPTYILRVIKLSKTSTKVSNLVYHLEFKNWPDFGVPSTFESILELIQVKNQLIKDKGLNEQLLVHCSAGCGRTGSFITLDMIIDCFSREGKDVEIDPWGDNDLIYTSVQNQRQQRISMVQNLDQFIVCYEIILEYLSKNEKIGFKNGMEIG